MIERLQCKMLLDIQASVDGILRLRGRRVDPHPVRSMAGCSSETAAAPEVLDLRCKVGVLPCRPWPSVSKMRKQFLTRQCRLFFFP